MRLIQSGLILMAMVVLIKSQDDGKYRPPSTTRRPLVLQTNRPLNGNNDGRYRPNNDGRYNIGNDGRYIPSEEGKYKGNIGGDYVGGGGEYTGGGGQYTESKGDAYIPDKNRATYSSIATTTSAPRPTVKGTGTGEGGRGWRIIRSDKGNEQDGYHYLYETENGILAEEDGRFENTGKENEGLLKVRGFYQYTGDDGNLYRIDYSADDNGFVPQGDHLPPVPDSVRRLLEYLRANGKL